MACGSKPMCVGSLCILFGEDELFANSQLLGGQANGLDSYPSANVVEELEEAVEGCTVLVDFIEQQYMARVLIRNFEESSAPDYLSQGIVYHDSSERAGLAATPQEESKGVEETPTAVEQANYPPWMVGQLG